MHARMVGFEDVGELGSFSAASFSAAGKLMFSGVAIDSGGKGEKHPPEPTCREEVAVL